MKLATASALILAVCGGASAFSAGPAASGPAATALRATATETYTFTKSEEIFAEAKTVSFGLPFVLDAIEAVISSCGTGW